MVYSPADRSRRGRLSDPDNASIWIQPRVNVGEDPCVCPLEGTTKYRSCDDLSLGVHTCRMRRSISIRLSKDLAAWLKIAAAESGVSQSELVRDQLEKARFNRGAQDFMRLAGAVRGPKHLSRRRGFARS